ncbi:diguanylate cyclase [Persephonella sp.]
MLFKIKDYMSQNPVTVNPDTSFKEIVEIMKDKKIGSVIVTDGENRLLDIVTQSDLILQLLHGNLESKVKDFIKKRKIISIDENAHVFDAVAYFEKFNIKHIPVLNSENKLVGIITATDVLKKVAGIGLIDHLTGLNNRNYFELLKQKYYEKMLSVSVILADLDNFKNINDIYGHFVGDMVLSEVSKIIKKDLRMYDEVIRWGGEEFLILLPRTNIKRTMIIARRLKDKISKIKFKDYPDLKITISMGISHYEGLGKNIDLAVNEADLALLRSKRSGKNRISTGRFIINVKDKTEKVAIEG